MSYAAGVLESLINPDVLARADEIARLFRQAKPFCHVIIDDFLRPNIAEEMLRSFPSHPEPAKLLNEFGQPNPKSAISDVRSLANVFVDVDDYIQTNHFLNFMSHITSIEDLRYDPEYYGGGTHENFHGAGLDAHYDFNMLPGTGQHRRLNAIVYLNKEWDPAWGGAIRFHTDPWDLQHDEITETPLAFNRCVIFETNERSWHSVETVNLPSELRHLSRKSFAIYLYTDERPAEEVAPVHGTVYVQGGLPKSIQVGRTLDENDVAELESNLARRQSYLREMYKREYQFSAAIESLRKQLRVGSTGRELSDELSIASQAVRQELATSARTPAKSWRQRFASRGDETPLFDLEWISRQLPGAKGITVDQFLADERFHEVSPHPLFDAKHYLDRYPDVRASGVSPLRHYLRHGWREGRDPHAFFANDWYLYRNPDVLAAREVPLEHYVRIGWRQGRWPHPRFDPQDYLLRHPDVKRAGDEPLAHFLEAGASAA